MVKAIFKEWLMQPIGEASSPSCDDCMCIDDLKQSATATEPSPIRHGVEYEHAVAGPERW